MMLAVEFSDFGFGTVVGAVVAGSIAIFLDQRRRSDEKKSRFLEDKRLMYRNVAQAFDLLAEQIFLFMKWAEIYDRVEELDPEALQLLEEMGQALKRSLAESRQRYFDHGVDFSLLGSKASAEAAIRLLETLKRLLSCVATGQSGELAGLQEEYELAAGNFRSIARRDLGLEN